MKTLRLTVEEESESINDSKEFLKNSLTEFLESLDFENNNISLKMELVARIHPKKRTIIDADFALWFENLIAPYKAVETEKAFEKEVISNNFTNDCPSVFKYKNGRIKFISMCREYCSSHSIPYTEFREIKDMFVIYPSAKTVEMAQKQSKTNKQ